MANTRRDSSISEKRASQWEAVMRKFSRAQEQECRHVSLKIPRTLRSKKLFPTGSQYDGSWDVLGMSGYGIYTFPYGVIYEGDFEDGMFHGVGQLRYPDGSVIKGLFNKGVISNRKLIFKGGLMYDEENWSYCKMPDRRFAKEYEIGIEPAGRSNITAEMPPRDIPYGYYDAGDGFYCSKTKSVYKYQDLTAMLRSPSKREQDWIVANCRTNPDTKMGPRPDLYEEWSVPRLKLPHLPMPAANSEAMTFNRKRSIYSYTSSVDFDLESLSCHRPSRLSSIYPGYDDTVEYLDLDHYLKLSGESRNSATAIIEKVKSYNTRLGKEDAHLKFSTVPKNYSELVSKDINIAFATLFQNPSHRKNSKLVKTASGFEANNKLNRDLQGKSPNTTEKINNIFDTGTEFNIPNTTITITDS